MKKLKHNKSSELILCNSDTAIRMVGLSILVRIEPVIATVKYKEDFLSLNKTLLKTKL